MTGPWPNPTDSTGSINQEDLQNLKRVNAPLYDSTLKPSDHLLANQKEDDSQDKDDIHGPPGDKTNVPRTFINFLKSNIGSGILGLPYAFLQGGVIFSIFSLIALAMISNYCIRLLITVSDELERVHGKMFSFGGVGQILFGTLGRVVVDLCLLFTQAGFCCAYVIFMGDNLNAIYDGIPSWGYVFLLVIPLTLVCWVRSFRVLAVLSLIGQVTMCVGLCIIMVFSVMSAVETKPALKAINFEGIPVFFGMAVYTYEGIGLVLPMRREMIEPHRYTMVLDVGYMLMTLLYCAFGTIGYCGYGANVDAAGITLNLPVGSIWTLITQITLIIAIFATYPVQMFPVIAILEGLTFGGKFRMLAKLSGFKLEASRNIMRALLVIFTSLVAISIPYFSLFVSLVGAFGSSILAFILPCAFYIKLFPKSGISRKVVNYLLVVFGVVASAVSTTMTIYQLILAIFHL